MRRLWMRHTVVTGAAAIALALGVGIADAQPRYERDRYADRRAEDCHFYAREQAYRYAPPGTGAMGGVARGAVGGAVFGAIVGGGRGARRGALAGGALGAVANGARNQADRDHAYRRSYEDCMDGYRR